jgi:hypothetical protein
MFTRLGKRGRAPTSGPWVRTGAVSTSGTLHRMRLPIDRIATEMLADPRWCQAPGATFPIARRVAATTGASNGITTGRTRAGPSTVTRRGNQPRLDHAGNGAHFHAVAGSVSLSRTNRMKQRAARTARPGRRRRCGPRIRNRSRRRRRPHRQDLVGPDTEVPVGQEAVWPGVRFSGPRVSSSTMKSLPAPVSW